MTKTATLNEKLSVSAIKNGTVIDHIPSGQALKIIKLLTLLRRKCQIMAGLNLSSKRLGSKDLIKVANYILQEEEANQIVVFAPPVTINIIQNYEVVKKISTHLPSSIKSVFICPNKACITQSENIPSYFDINEEGKQIKLTCHYCEKIFLRDQLIITL